MRGRWRVWHWSALIAALAIVVTVAAFVTRTSNAAPEQFTLRMRPAPPLTMTECIAEATPYGYSPHGASEICSVGLGRNWYRAILKNNGAGAYPLCRAKAFEADSNIVFSGQLVFDFGGHVRKLANAGADIRTLVAGPASPTAFCPPACRAPASVPSRPSSPRGRAASAVHAGRAARSPRGAALAERQRRRATGRSVRARRVPRSRRRAAGHCRSA
jgi:hypothetical protein